MNQLQFSGHHVVMEDNALARRVTRPIARIYLQRIVVMTHFSSGARRIVRAFGL